MFAESGSLALIALICPFEEDRRLIRAAARRRGPAVPRGLRGHLARGVRAARPQGPLRPGPAGQLPGFTGIDSDYELPVSPDLVLGPTRGACPSRCRGCWSCSSNCSASGWPRRTAANAGSSNPSWTAPGRAQGGAQGGRGHRWERRRRRLAWVSVAVLIVVGAGIALPLLLTSSNTPSNQHGGRARCRHTLCLKLPAASALAEQGGSAWVTDDLRDLLLRFDPTTGRVEHSVHLPGRPVALVLAQGHLWVADAVDNQVVEVDPSTLLLHAASGCPAEPTSLAALDGDAVGDLARGARGDADQPEDRHGGPAGRRAGGGGARGGGVRRALGDRHHQRADQGHTGVRGLLGRSRRRSRSGRDRSAWRPDWVRYGWPTRRTGRCPRCRRRACW